jgi:predicted SprT family Zn-dependent metalloprotease
VFPTAETNETKPNATPVPDAETNRAIRDIASTPTEQHLIPAPIVAALYAHIDDMRAAFFDGKLPEVVLSFDVRNRKNLGHYCLRRNGLGVRWNVNLNPIHLGRPLYEVLATLLHELAHAWQYEKGTGGKPPHHNREFVEKCEAMGIPTDSQGHYLGVNQASPFHDYCKAHGVPFETPAGDAGDEEPERPEPLLPTPPAKPKGSKLRKWICSCEDPVPVRVARADFDATCNKCKEPYRLA